jgi:hypothetical protein
MAKRDISDPARGFKAKLGEYLMVCSKCNAICNSKDMKKQWNGVYACTRAVNNCWNPYDVFDRPIKIGKDSAPKIIQPSKYDPEDTGE